MKPIRIVLADDHALMRAGIRTLCETLDGVTVVAEAADGNQALQAGASGYLLKDAAVPKFELRGTALSCHGNPVVERIGPSSAASASRG